MFYSLLVGGKLMTIEEPILSDHGYQLLPLATSQLVDNNRNLISQAYFHLFYLLLVEGSL